MMSSNVIKLPGIKEAPKNTPRTDRSIMDTVLLTPDGIDRWELPPFQREKRITPKVLALIEQLKVDGGIVPGIITLGKLGGATFLVDGQHRIEAFRQSGLGEGLANVRICHFDTMADMADEFVTLNSSLVRMRPDDFMRGLEPTNEWLAYIRKACPFVGYSNVRQNANSKVVVAMSTSLRAWFGSAGEVPDPGPTGIDAAKTLTEDEARRFCHVMKVCHEAWGNAPENYRLWSALNLGLVFWMWRKLVLRENVERKRGGLAIATLTPDQFRQCLLALSANGRYVEWLIGRRFAERDRSAAYGHVKSIFAGRIGGMGLGRPTLPAPEWGGR